jgi:hypothetical protein
MPIFVNCGKSGVLRTKLIVRASEPVLALAQASEIICQRELAWAKATFGFEDTLRPMSAPSLRANGSYSCGAWGTPTPRGETSYFLSTEISPQKTGTYPNVQIVPCVFRVYTEYKSNTGAGGQSGPTTKRSYNATCKSLRS